MKTLYDLNVGEEAIIYDFNKSYALSLRLCEIGLIKGRNLRLIKKGPFGGPVQIKLNNNYIAIRKEDAKMIYIKRK